MGVSKRSAGKAAATLRVPVALKFTLTIALLVVAFMAWQTYTAMEAAKERVEAEINASGIQLVAALTSLLEPAWDREPGQQEALKGALRRLREHPGAGRVLNVVVYDDAKQQAVATARDEARFSITVGEAVDDPAGAAAGVEIRQFEYEGIPARSFTAPYPGATGGGGGAGTSASLRVGVYVSAAAIEESIRRVSTAMVQVSAAACLAAALGSFLLAQFLTRPIRALVKDMRHVSLGHLEHKTAVRSGDELGDLALAFNHMTANLKAAQEAKLAQKAMEHELTLATRIQARLLPAQIPHAPGFDIARHYAPAREVGGDYYDFLRIDRDRLGVVVADVSGKGIPAALVMTMTRSLLRAAARGEESPAKAVELVNRSLTPDMSPGMFVTLAYLVLDARTREARLVRSGHNPPLFFSAKHGKVLHIHPRGMALGLDREGSLFQAELQVQRLVLNPGDVLALYTDGIVEGKDREGHDYSTERLESVLASSASLGAQGIVEAVVADLAAHERGTEPSDDVTIIVLKSI